MKKTLLMLSILSGMLLSGNTFAGTGGPDNFGYTWKDSNEPGGPAFNWIDIKSKTGATQVKLLSDDNTMGPFSIPFKFHYYWYDLNKFWVGSNGYVIFNAGNMAHPFPAIPSPSAPNDFVAIMETDLTFDQGPGATNPAECYYWFNPAHDTLIVSYLNVPFWEDQLSNPDEFTGSNTFQVIFSAVDSSITMQYKHQDGSSASASQVMTIGIENISGAVGLQHSYDTYPDTTYAVKYYYPASTSFSVKDAAVSWADNPQTGASFLSWKGAKQTLKAEIKNTGNVTLNPFNVNGKVVNKSSIVQGQQSTFLSDTLDPAASQTISFQNQFNPANQGIFRFITTTQLAGDAVFTNNVLSQELNVVDTSATQILLSYSDNTSEGTGLSWSGGGGGAGVYIKPPFYPCKVTKLRFFIVGNPLQSTFDGKVYDDDGIGGLAGTLIDSVRPSVEPIDDAGHWEEVSLNTPFYVESGGFYVGWLMAGSNIGLGQDGGTPISNRTYEVLGNSWAIYRSREVEDLMIGAYIEKSATGVAENNASAGVGEFYPNPSTEKTSLNYTLVNAGKVSVKLFDIQGRNISKEEFKTQSAGTHRLDISLDELNTGIYFCEITTDKGVATRKFSVIK